MTAYSFSLIPFATPIPNISITGEISFQNNIITLHYSLVGKLEDILLASKSLDPSRKNELWSRTCFEFFLAIKDQPQYWEFNMSPSGDWNVYHMDAYRRIGFREETSLQRLPFEFRNARVAQSSQRQHSRNESGMCTLDAVVDLNPILQPNQFLDIGITAVIQTTDGDETYWALAHPAPKADFHLRESFILGLAEPVPLSSQSAPGG